MTTQPEDKQNPRKTASQEYFGSIVVSPMVDLIQKHAEEDRRQRKIFQKHVAPFVFSPKDQIGLYNIRNIGNFYYNLFYFNQREQ